MTDSDNQVIRSIDMCDRMQKRIVERADKYDEKFLASIGIHKDSRGRYDPEEIKEFMSKYERKYSTVTTEEGSSVATRSGYKWQRKDNAND